MRFTLQPVFASPARQFRCHLRRRRPLVFYQLWFYVSVPAANFETPHTRLNVSQTTSGSGGRHDVTTSVTSEFLSVDHVTGLRLDADELVLTGRRDDVTSAAAAGWNYSVLPVRGGAGRRGDAWRQIESHAISNSIRVLTAETDEPFAVSTSSWVAPSTSCQVDVSHFRPVDASRSAGGVGGGQKVTADVASRDDGAFQYRLKSLNNPPHIKFLIPGQCSSFNHHDDVASVASSVASVNLFVCARLSILYKENG